jgi:HD-GYP domain-containing protein (c-di-GMP phosphodiesterase class II)
MKTNPTQTIDELITAISFIIDVEANKKLYHGWRVAVLADRLARRLSPQKRKEIFYAALLHDVGAVGLTSHIIHFLREESKKNQTILLSHPIIGAQLVSTIPRMNPVAKLILDHHEWFNGLGYPRGKTIRYIPEGAQLLRAADYMDITMRFKCGNKLNCVIKKVRILADKEISKNLSGSAIKSLKRQRFFYNICKDHHFPEIFYRAKKSVGQIHMAKGIDAIGKTLEIMAQIIDMKHPFTAGHSTRVSRYAMTIALAMKLKHDDITRIRWAGLIHDAGKLTVPRKILDKPTGLTRKEYEVVKKHPVMTRKILEMSPTLSEISPIASSHHEYFDGTGYPHGLKGNQATIGARILAVCDAFDAMTSNRPYRRPFTPTEACREIQKCAGKQFDPEIVKASVHIFKNLCV